MKRIFVMAMLLLFAATVHAEQVSNSSLVKILKAKGLLSDDEIKAIQQDKKNNMEFFGQFQIQYLNESADSNTGAKGKSDFIVKRARLGWRAWVSDPAYVNVLGEFGSSSASTVTLLDAYFGFPFSPTYEIMVGQLYVPFSRETITGTGKIFLVDQSLAASMAPQRQLGITIKGNSASKFVEYQLGLYNGALDTTAITAASGTAVKMKSRLYQNTLQSANDNTGHMAVARLELHPAGYLAKGFENLDHETKYTVGASYYNSVDSNVNFTKAETICSNAAVTAGSACTTSTTLANAKGSNGVEVDLQFRTGGMDLYAEYAKRRFEWIYSGTAYNADQSLVVLMASYLVTDSVSVAARYENLDYGNTSTNHIQGTSGQKSDTYTTVGANWYLPKHNLKLQANYVMKKENMVAAGASEPKNDQFLLQANYLF